MESTLPCGNGTFHPSEAQEQLSHRGRVIGTYRCSSMLCVLMVIIAHAMCCSGKDTADHAPCHREAGSPILGHRAARTLVHGLLDRMVLNPILMCPFKELRMENTKVGAMGGPRSPLTALGCHRSGPTFFLTTHPFCSYLLVSEEKPLGGAATV